MRGKYKSATKRNHQISSLKFNKFPITFGVNYVKITFCEAQLVFNVCRMLVHDQNGNYKRPQDQLSQNLVGTERTKIRKLEHGERTLEEASSHDWILSS